MCIMFGIPIDGFDYRPQESDGHSGYHDVEDPDQIIKCIICVLTMLTALL
jgi:hypothetical protein